MAEPKEQLDELAHSIFRDTDGYLIFAGSAVRFEDLQKIFGGAPVLKRRADGSIVEVTALGEEEVVGIADGSLYKGPPLS